MDLFYKILTAPLSLLYGVGILFWDLMYKHGILRGHRFDIPTISVGNLTVGGTGKTPHVEYLLTFLRQYIRVGTLSRGYKRKTRGFLIVQPENTAKEVGDEPLQYKRKFPGTMVTVSEDRTFAIPQMLMTDQRLQAVLLDDAFQHRAIIPGMNILLTEFSAPFTRDYLLPSGRLREWRSAYQRASLIIVSKCPDRVTEEERILLINEIQPTAKQKVFFSYYKYSNPYYIFNGNQRLQLSDDWDVVLFCGIAKIDYLVEYLKNTVNSVRLMDFGDHHFFTPQEVGNLKGTYDDLPAKNKVIITTEKDAIRLDLHREYLIEHKLPVFVLPAQVAFHFDQEDEFRETVVSYLMNFKV